MREAEDADRVWRATMGLDVQPVGGRETLLAARRLHAVWQEREQAHARVRELEHLIARGDRRSRLERLQSGGSFLAWHARRRLRSSSLN